MVCSCYWIFWRHVRFSSLKHRNDAFRFWISCSLLLRTCWRTIGKSYLSRHWITILEKKFFWQVWTRSGDADELGPCHGNLEGGRVVQTLVLCRSGIALFLAVEIQIDLLFFFSTFDSVLRLKELIWIIQGHFLLTWSLWSEIGIGTLGNV